MGIFFEAFYGYSFQFVCEGGFVRLVEFLPFYELKPFTHEKMRENNF